MIYNKHGFLVPIDISTPTSHQQQLTGYTTHIIWNLDFKIDLDI